MAPYSKGMRFPDGDGGIMSVLTTAAFWAATGERAIRTAAQSTLGVLSANATGLADIDWAAVGSIVGTATALSVLTSIVATGVGNRGPSLATEELVPAVPPAPPAAALGV